MALSSPARGHMAPWRHKAPNSVAVHAKMQIGGDILTGLGKGEIDSVSAFVASRKHALAQDDHIMGLRMVVSMHNGINARFGDRLSGPVGVCRHRKAPSDSCWWVRISELSEA